MKKGRLASPPGHRWLRTLLLAVTQRPDVRRNLIDLFVVDVRAASGRHRDAALRLFLGHALLDVCSYGRIGPIAMEPLVIDQVGGRSEHALRVLAVAGIAVPGARENGLALVDLILSDSAREPLRQRRHCGEKAEGDEQAKT